MHPTIAQLIKEIKAKRVFRRNNKKIELKNLLALLYFYGLSLRKVSKFLFKTTRKEKRRRSIAIDETKIKLENKQIFVWSAIDADTKECLLIWASEGRSSFQCLRFP